MDTEIWKDVVWYEWLYQVSNLWKVLSKNHNRTWESKEMKLMNRLGYMSIILSKKWVVTTSRVHRLVAIAFITNPENKKCVNHKNGIKTDNRLENLEWCTASENQWHIYNVLWKKNNTPNKWKYWKDNNKSKIVIQISKEWVVIGKYWGIWEAERITRVPNQNISKCCRGNLKSAGWFIWKYL